MQHEVHIKSVGLTETGDIAFIADFPHETCLPGEGQDCTWCDHLVIVPPEALANRLHGYGLETKEEAFDAIVREHALRLHHVLGQEHPHLKQNNGLVPEGDGQVHQHGGLHSKVTIRHGQLRLSDVLAFHEERIQQTLEGVEPRKFSEESVGGISEAHRNLLLEGEGA